MNPIAWRECQEFNQPYYQKNRSLKLSSQLLTVPIKLKETYGQCSVSKCILGTFFGCTFIRFFFFLYTFKKKSPCIKAERVAVIVKAGSHQTELNPTRTSLFVLFIASTFCSCLMTQKWILQLRASKQAMHSWNAVLWERNASKAGWPGEILQKAVTGVRIFINLQ